MTEQEQINYLSDIIVEIVALQTQHQIQKKGQVLRKVNHNRAEYVFRFKWDGEPEAGNQYKLVIYDPDFSAELLVLEKNWKRICFLNWTKLTAQELLDTIRDYEVTEVMDS